MVSMLSAVFVVDELFLCETSRQPHSFPHRVHTIYLLTLGDFVFQITLSLKF